MRQGLWVTMTATQRGRLMLRLADLVTQSAERLAEVELCDNGKLTAEMHAQVNHPPDWWRDNGG